MIRTALSLIVLVPAVAIAQVAGGASSQSTTKAQTAGGSVELSTSVDAEVTAARAKGLPERPMTRRVAEGRAKGASEAALASSARQLRLSMESAADVMAQAGRKPSADEIERGAYAFERGYSRA